MFVEIVTSLTWPAEIVFQSTAL